MAHRVDILLFDGVEELDAVGPWEVLAAWCNNHPEDGWTVRMISLGAQPVLCGKGLTLSAHAGLDDLEGTEVLIHPGGIGTRRLMHDDEHLAWLHTARAKVPVLASVCSGASVLAAAELLRNRRVTTHWLTVGLLEETDPTVVVDRQERWIDDGDIVTSAGVSAGIEMALHFVERFASAARAEEVCHYIDYEPSWRAESVLSEEDS